MLEEACELLCEALPEGAFFPFDKRKFFAFFHVFFEDVSLQQGSVAVGEDCRYLVGKAQASRVDVGTSDGGQSIVHDDGFGVHVASLVEVYLYALAQEQVVVGGGGFWDENAFVATDREHEPHFHSSVAGGFEGGLYAWGGDEIGGLEVDVALRMVEHVADEGFHTHDFVGGIDR